MKLCVDIDLFYVIFQDIFNKYYMDMQKIMVENKITRILI